MKSNSHALIIESNFYQIKMLHLKYDIESCKFSSCETKCEILKQVFKMSTFDLAKNKVK
jgi:hypothetical protein